MRDAVLAAIIALITSFAGSLGSLAVWFHFDLDGWWEQKRIEKGRRYELRGNPRLQREAERVRRDQWRGR